MKIVRSKLMKITW